MHTQINLNSLTSIIDGVSADPASVLGPHAIHVDGKNAVAVRGYFPGFDQAWLLDDRNSAARPMRRIHPSGLYEGLMPQLESTPPEYRFRLSNSSG